MPTPLTGPRPYSNVAILHTVNLAFQYVQLTVRIVPAWDKGTIIVGLYKPGMATSYRG